MEDIQITEKQKELLDIVLSILSSLKIKEEKENQIPLKDAIVKIKQFFCKDEDKELEHYAYFVKQLFLDENGNLDFNSEQLIEMISKNTVISIFDSLIECIKMKPFLEFLLLLGEIFSDIYINQQNNVEDVIDEFEHSGKNNYEMMFIIFSKCKKCEKIEYIMDNYDIYYSETYLIEISYDLILANDAYIKLCISSPNYDNLSDLLSDEEKTSDNSGDKSIIIDKFQENIFKSLKTFWINSHFLFSVDLDDFMNILYSFIMQSESKNFILENKYDENMKQYLEYMSFYLEKLFKNFNEDSLKDFGQSLYNYVEKNELKNIGFIKRALLIKNIYNLKNEEVGLITLICGNSNFIEKMEKIADSTKAYDEKVLEAIVKEQGLSKYEIMVLGQIFDERIKNNSPNGSSNQIINDNQTINKEESKSIENSEIELKKEDYDDDPKYQALIEKMDSLNNKISDLTHELSNVREKNEKEISKLKQDIEKLNDIHRRIYFRDVSKFYINQFAKTYKIDGSDTFHICQNIMSSNFSKLKAKELKDIIIKIVSHYLQGNKFAHMQYFISKSKSGKKLDLANEIENSYSEFMKFNEENKKLLTSKFQIIKAPFIYKHRFK